MVYAIILEKKIFEAKSQKKRGLRRKNSLSTKRKMLQKRGKRSS